MTALDVHVWTISVTGAAPDDTALSAGERTRAARFLAEGDRRDYVAAHVLLRRALSSVDPAYAPHEWEFVVGEHGRPELPDRRIRFNLSHARGVVACVIAGTDCGIDVERLEPERDLPRRRVLTADESAALAALPAAEQPLRYARLWTLKEAYAKARGLGLDLPFDRLRVDLTDPPRITDSSAGAPAADWHCEEWLPTPAHVAALVAAGRGVRVVHHTGMP
ncbi:MAG: 4-phosphopantetheinyl transferase [Frankiaceae bacterium]|nr:4-phosphopantetheinyl transferase [Frankiaceae bacterium]